MKISNIKIGVIGLGYVGLPICNVFSKKYIEPDELFADNDKDIYYDRQYDKTPYSIIDEYTDEKATMSPDDFYIFLYNNLQKNIGIDENTAKRDAKAMIEKINWQKELLEK